jgi:hypothetical protein
MAAATPLLLPRKSQDALVEYSRACYELLGSQWNLRARMREMDLAYMREQDLSKEHNKAKLANSYGDKTKFQNITVPVVLPQVEAAVTYQASVFLTGTPIFGVVSNPQYIDEALQMETVIEEQSIRGGWVAQLLKFFRNGFKYNLSAIEVSWEDYIVPAFESDISFANGREAKPKEVLYSGNCLKNLDPYNLLFDTRVPPSEMYKRGEFSGYTQMMSRIELKSYINSLPNKMVENVTAAFESAVSGGGYETYYVPELNSKAFLTAQSAKGNFDWMRWASLSTSEKKIQYRNSYEVTTLYARILPSDFAIRVPASNTPQIWKLVIVNNSVLIYAERQSNAHNNLPILFGQPLEDGLGYQTKSLADNAVPFQDLSSALWNSVIAARRRAVSDRGIYDPSRISADHINNENPSAKIPVRPSAYGKPVGESYFPIPFRDDQTAIIFQEAAQIGQMANEVSGQNKARQGQFVKGNKTRDEFQTVMGNANGRDQMISMLLEAQVFTPLKEILKTNILQYQGGVSLYNRQTEQSVDIDPVQLRKAVLEFKISDGLTPTDKLINADTLQVAMQMIGSSPLLSQNYNVAPLFSYLMKTQGARIAEFEKSPQQVAFEQAMQSWQQVAMEAAKSGAAIPPQPTPQQFGYDPQTGAPAPASQPETRVNNITNNITDNRGAQV